MVTGNFTQEEIDFLKEFYPKYGTEYCAEKLGREKSSISSKIRKLKLNLTGVRYKYSKENLEPIVLNSNSITEILKKMGLRSAGGNAKVINKYIEKYQINISHFNWKETNNNILRLLHKAQSLEEILVENSKYNRNHLKNRLYKEGLKQHKCELCGQGEEWMGKRMSLILDHKNGIPNDNRLENLRIVCPNCNATLDTHCRGQKGLKDIKIIESKQEIKKQNLIEKGLKSRKVIRPPYEELKKEVSFYGYSATGRKYGVSDNAVRKWIKNYEK